MNFKIIYLPLFFFAQFCFSEIDENNLNLAIDTNNYDMAESMLSPLAFYARNTEDWNILCRAFIRAISKTILNDQDQDNNRIISYLIFHGVNINFEDSEENPALFLAIKQFKVSVVRLLLNYGCDFNKRNKNDLQTPLSYAKAIFKNILSDDPNYEKCRRIIELLKGYGAKDTYSSCCTIL